MSAFYISLLLNSSDGFTNFLQQRIYEFFPEMLLFTWAVHKNHNKQTQFCEKFVDSLLQKIRDEFVKWIISTVICTLNRD